MSVHEALVVPLNYTKLENSDHLSVMKVGGYTCVLRTEDWIGKTRAIYVEPDHLVDVSKPGCEFLAKDAKFDKFSNKGTTHAKVKSRRFLNIVQSYGVLLPVDESIPIGTDMFETLNMGRYEPPTLVEAVSDGEIGVAPTKFKDLFKYDIESALKIDKVSELSFAKNAFVEGEKVLGVLKYNGENISFVFTEGDFHVRSRSYWKREYASKPEPSIEGLIAKHGEEKGIKIYDNIMAKLENWQPSRSKWWRYLREDEILQKFLRDNPDVIVWGEEIGKHPKFKYQLSQGKIGLRVFDIYKDDKFMDALPAREFAKDLPWAKIVFEEPFNLEKHVNYVENMPVIENIGGIEEGIVISPLIERYAHRIGRVKLKLINPQYTN